MVSRVVIGVIGVGLMTVSLGRAGAAGPRVDRRDQATPPAAGQAARSACPVAADPELGHSAAKAIRIGGGAMYVAARERRYLETLRGPGGETLTFARKGSTRASPDQLGPVDIYQVTYAGGSSATLYLDVYHYEELVAPQGFICGQDRLGPPPIDAFMAGDLQVRLALAQGVEQEFAPIPLDPGGATTYGVAFDRFRLLARAARAAAASGAPLDPETLPRDLAQRGLTLVAYPVTCGERTITPTTIDIVPRQGAPVRRAGDVVSGDAIARLVPGFEAPSGAIAATFPLAMFRPIDTVQIAYDGEVCAGGGRTATLPVRMSAMRGVDMPQPTSEGEAAPAGAVWLQVVVDHDGQLRMPTYLGGPEAYQERAIAQLRDWRAEPARINTAPVVADSIVFIRFR